MAAAEIKFLVSPSVSVTNGSKVVMLTGGVNAYHVYKGTAIFIGDLPPVEGESGTIPDGGGNSTILLRKPWAGATLTAPLVAFNSIEGLTEAIRRARDIGDKTLALLDGFELLVNSDQATVDIEINGVIEQKVPYTYLSNVITTLVSDAQGASDTLTALQSDVSILQNTVTTIQADLDNDKQASAASASAASDDAIQTALDVITTDNNVTATNADVIATNADAVTTNADVTTTNNNVIATNADVIATNNDVTATNNNVIATSADVIATNADVIATNADVTATNADVIATGSNVTATNADVVTTNNNVIEATLQKTLATDAAAISLANANFMGDWSGLVGDAAVPMSMRHDDAIYMLNNYVADITLSEPDVLGTNTDFFLLGVIGATTPDSDRLGGELPAYYASAQQITDLQTSLIDSQNSLTETLRKLRLNTLTGKRIYRV